MNKYKLDIKEYTRCARQVVADSCVLIKNDNSVLPLKEGDNIAVFGRSAFNYYKSGLGSGGLVNTRYVISILDALKGCKRIDLNSKLMRIYENWIEKNPFEHGTGWGNILLSQKEMPLDLSTVENAKEQSDTALVIIGRTAGEDQDLKYEPGSYKLTDGEENMLDIVTSVFDKVAVVLNVGNIIDMNWVAKYNPSSVLYAWQGGQEGGNGVLDVLMGDVNPSGRLTDTIAKQIFDYPSTQNFGDIKENYYKEDIYVGYRYFETLARDKVLYPFGFGLSYTTFHITGQIIDVNNDKIFVQAEISNTGSVAGREVVQLYVKAPQGKLGKPARSLVAFAKTNTIAPNSSEKIDFAIDKYAMASYDDSGVTGHKSCYLLEEGSYEFFLGNNVRGAKSIGSYQEQFNLLERLQEAMAPLKEFNRIKPIENTDNTYSICEERVPTRCIDLDERIESLNGRPIEYTGDIGYKLEDVFDGNVDLDKFVGQLSDDDIACLVRGEGMCSPKATGGTASAFGGVTPSLSHFGIPVACSADGPSGIRIDTGKKAFSLPNGTAMACTFDSNLIEELSRHLGLELRKNKIDVILGPGINIHRNPLNGRNFEFFSEDPYLTGVMATAQIKGFTYAGVTGTLKHFVANNQEYGRNCADSIISERALREIYLKGFEMAVKDGGAYSLMTSYGPVNGIWTAGNYDLCTTILRNEWGFDGLVMTDWWAVANFEGEEAFKGNVAAMIRAQNDIYMVTEDSLNNADKDNTIEMLNKGVITRWQLQRSAKNILKFIMHSPIMLHYLDRISKDELDDMKSCDEENETYGSAVLCKTDNGKLELDGLSIDTSVGSSAVFALILDKYGEYEIVFKMKSELNLLAQLSINVFLDKELMATVAMHGTEGKTIQRSYPLGMIVGPNHYLRLHFGQTGIDLESVIIQLVED